MDTKIIFHLLQPMIQPNNINLTSVGFEIHFSFHFEQKLGRCVVGAFLSFPWLSLSLGLSWEIDFSLD
jgi:hypothetical protein